MLAIHLPAFGYQRQRWKNNLGWTREIARQPGAGDEFDWRLSLADIDQDCGFSRFPGYQRSLVLLSGNGMRFRFDDGEVAELHPPHGRCDFSGDRALSCELLDGPTQDFNLIWRPDRVDARLLHRPLVGSMVFFAEPGSEWLIFNLAGHANVNVAGNSIALEPQDSVRLHPLAEQGRAQLEGAGELLIIKIDRLV
ncbi:HutD/Ves family protein [Pseudomarimonas arenosa]|uniref:HutD family protein n=1 Tax=Pseudomarimonas arenosa TaxID=2774145 RepID=A0AAW3ZK46_9GAMM|nr:HutD family protein [Pseudomarimonas arenosa]MBD8526488.1 HutD family protein [Pseudomarimonas arenosa]